MADDQRAAEYEICKRRGHQPSGITTASIPPQSICKWCGTHYWYTQPELREGMKPFEMSRAGASARGDTDAG